MFSRPALAALRMCYDLAGQKVRLRVQGLDISHIYLPSERVYKTAQSSVNMKSKPLFDPKVLSRETHAIRSSAASLGSAFVSAGGNFCIFLV